MVKALTMAQLASVPGADTWFLCGVTMVARFAIAALIVFAVLLRGSIRCTRAEFFQGLGVGIFGSFTGYLANLFLSPAKVRTEAAPGKVLRSGVDTRTVTVH